MTADDAPTLPDLIRQAVRDDVPGDRRALVRTVAAQTVILGVLKERHEAFRGALTDVLGEGGSQKVASVAAATVTVQTNTPTVTDPDRLAEWLTEHDDPLAAKVEHRDGIDWQALQSAYNTNPAVRAVIDVLADEHNATTRHALLPETAAEQIAERHVTKTGDQYAAGDALDKDGKRIPGLTIAAGKAPGLQVRLDPKWRGKVADVLTAQTAAPTPEGDDAT